MTGWEKASWRGRRGDCQRNVCRLPVPQVHMASEKQRPCRKDCDRIAHSVLKYFWNLSNETYVYSWAVTDYMYSGLINRFPKSKYL